MICFDLSIGIIYTIKIYFITDFIFKFHSKLFQVMKNIILVLLVQFTLLAYAQNKHKTLWIDENGKAISNEEFLIKIRKPNNFYNSWKYSNKDTAQVTRLYTKKYETCKVDTEVFQNYFSSITNKKYSKNTTFLIEYRYLDDYCEGEPTNYWTYNRMNMSTKFTSRIKIDIEKKIQNLVYLIFFEEGFKFYKPRKNNEHEYYFADKSNFLRNSIFKSPSICGSFMLIKPNGETLIRNGEHRADYMLEYLKPEVWISIFGE